jgi:transposase
LWAGELDAVWTPDEQTGVLRRRLARRGRLVRARSRAKNEIQAVLLRRLKGKPPLSDLFGVEARKWLAELELPVEEQETVAACLRHVEFRDREIAAVDALVAIARKILTLCYYGLRDGEIRCLKRPGGASAMKVMAPSQ